MQQDGNLFWILNADMFFLGLFFFFFVVSCADGELFPHKAVD